MARICKPCPHFPGTTYYGFQFSDVTCPLCLFAARLAALEATLSDMERRAASQSDASGDCDSA